MSEAKASAAKASQSAQPQRTGSGLRKRQPGMRPIPVSRDAQRIATAILEVLAGVRTPTEAAVAVSLSVPRYYLWEQRALEGLVRACEPRPKGQVMSQRHQITVLEKEVARLRQDCARQQALVRASQRTIGLAVSPLPAKPPARPGSKAAVKTSDGGKTKRKRRPVARALKAVAALQAPAVDHDQPLGTSGQYVVRETAAASPAASSAAGAEVVQRSVPSNSLATAEAALAAAAVPAS